MPARPNYAPDLLRVVDVMNRLHTLPCPDLPLNDAGRRWSAYLDREHDAELLCGEGLLHPDVNPLNILLEDHTTWIIDWAWPTCGATFVDPPASCSASWLTATDAETWAAKCDGWIQASPTAITAFATASARLFTEIADADPQPWKKQLATAARH